MEIGDIPAPFYVDLAAETDVSPEEIARRYQITDETLQFLYTKSWFRYRIDAERERLAATGGFDAKYRAAMYAEDLMRIVYQNARDTTDNLEAQIKALQAIAKLGGLEPKNNEIQLGGVGGFGIELHIHRSAGDTVAVTATSQTATIDHVPTAPQRTAVDFEIVGLKDAAPAALPSSNGLEVDFEPIGDVGLNFDLMAGVTA